MIGHVDDYKGQVWPPPIEEVVWHDSLVAVVHSRWENVIDRLPDWNMVLTDPPYHVHGFSGGGFGRNAIYKRDDLREMMDFDVRPFIEAMFKLRDALVVMCYCSRLQLAPYLAVATELGLVYDVHAWWKTNAIPFTNGSYKADVEYFVILNRGPKFFRDGQPQHLHSKITRSPLINSKLKRHCCQKPQGMVERYLRLNADRGTVVLDPFAGGLTTAFACRALGFRCIAIEEDLEDCQKGIVELNQGGLFGWQAQDPETSDT